MILHAAYSGGMDKLRSEFLHAWRALSRRPAYFLTCAATFALVLAANAAIFAVVNATLLLPMPFRDGDRVVQLYTLPPGLTEVHQRNPVQQMDFLRLRERATSLKSLEGYLPAERVVIEGGEPAVIRAAYVTGGLMAMMDARAARGRLIEPPDERPGQAVAVLAYQYWQYTLGGRDVVGSTLTLDGVPHEIVGVAGASFPPAFLEADVFTPLVPNSAPLGHNPSRSIIAFGEPAGDASLAVVREQVEAISREISAEFPAVRTGWTASAQPAREWRYGQTRAPVIALFGAAALVLLIACINVAGLTSAQASARARDLSLRVALGASGRDLLRAQIAELLIVAVAGALPGLLLARAAVPALLALDPTTARQLGPVVVDWRVQLFTLALAFMAALAAAVVPAMQASRGASAQHVADGGTRTAGSRRARQTRRVLIAGETALCLALLMAGGVLIDGLRAATRADAGYATANILSAQVRLPEASYPTVEARAAVVARMLEGVRSVPGVMSAATSMNDFIPGRAYQTLFHAENRPTPNGEPRATLFNRVSPGFFETLGIRLITGRTFTDQDHSAAPHTAVVSRLFAEQHFPGEEAVGRVIRRTAANAKPTTIIGVVEDVRDVNFTLAPEPTLYLAWAQNSTSVVPVTFAIRTAQDPLTVVSAVRAAVQAVDPALPLRRVQRLDAFLDESVAPVRFRAIVLGVIAALGLTLAALGVYGVAHRTVVERAREFAVRLALGARAGGVMRMVMLDAMVDVALGAVAGLAAGAALAAALARFVPQSGAASIASSAGAVAILAAAAAFATLVPVARILRLDAADALRR